MVILKVLPIEQFRQSSALSRTELATRLDVHFATLSKVLNGEPVALRVAKKIARALKVDTPKLIQAWQNVQHTSTE